MFDQVFDKIIKNIDERVTSGQFTLAEAKEMLEGLEYLAFNFIDSRPNKIYSGFERVDLVLPDAATKEEAYVWLFQLRKPSVRAVQVKPTPLEKSRGMQILEWAEECDLIVQTEFLVFFSQPLLQDYFCARFCQSKPLDLPLLEQTITGSKFKEIWPLWAALDNHLTANLLELVKQASDVKIRKYAIKARAFIGDMQVTEALLSIFDNINENKEIRISIAEDFLNKFHDPATIEVLLERLQDEDEDATIRFVAARSIGYSGEAAVSRLLTLFDTTVSKITQALVIKSLTFTNSKQAIKPIIAVVPDTDAQVRANAITALGELGPSDPLVVEILINALQDAEKEVRFSAVQALNQIQTTRAVGPLCDLLLREDYSPIIYEAINALHKLGDARAVPALLTNVNGVDKLRAKEAIYALGALGDSQVVPLLLDKLMDATQDLAMREACASALIHLWDRRIVELLLQILQQENTISWKIRAIGAIAKFGHPQAFELLTAFLYDERGTIASSAVHTLAHLEDKRAFNYFTDLVIKEDNRLKALAARGLGLLKDQRAVEPLIKLLEDGDAKVCYEAIRALAEIGDERAVPALQWLQWNDTSVYGLQRQIRRAAAQALELIQARI